MRFDALLQRFAAAVETGDGRALAALFTEDGVYDDVFYGAFEGREAIADMLENLFHRDASDFRWEFRDPVCDGHIGYASWLFSYTGRTEHTDGLRVVFDGASRFTLAQGLIARYEDVCNGAVPLKQMGAPATVMDRMLARWQAHLESQPGFADHKRGGA